MKIAFSGASGVGKTTTCKLLANQCSLPIVHSMARRIAEKRKIIPEQISDIDDLMEFQYEVISTKINEEIKLNDFVTDRFILDSYAYMLSKADSFKNISKKSEDLFNSCVDMIESHIPYYDCVFYFANNIIELKLDDIRQTHKIRNNSVDFLLQGLYRFYKISIIDIPKNIIETSPQSTCDYIKTIVCWKDYTLKLRQHNV